VDAEPFLRLFARIGATSREAAEAGDYRQALLDSTPNRYIKAPPNLEHRYMTEDMPFGLLPLAEVGRLASVPTPVLDAAVTIASVASGHDFRGTGRTLDRLGLQGRAVAEVLRLIQEGE
jgi:opine dehydrogenase